MFKGGWDNRNRKTLGTTFFIALKRLYLTPARGRLFVLLIFILLKRGHSAGAVPMSR